jgi:hypothetical protein
LVGYFISLKVQVNRDAIIIFSGLSSRIGAPAVQQCINYINSIHIVFCRIEQTEGSKTGMLLMQLYRDLFGRSYTEIEAEVNLGDDIGHHSFWNNIPTLRKSASFLGGKSNTAWYSS